VTKSIPVVAMVVVWCGLQTGCAPQYNTHQEAQANACSALGPRTTSGAVIGGLGGAAAIGGLAGGGRGAAIGAGAGVLAGAIGGLCVRA
jgi:hypothetical protein